MKRSTQSRIMQAITAIMLAATYFVAGFAVCAGMPGVTEQLATRYADAEGSPFTSAQLTQLAVATRDYTVGDHDLDALMGQVAQANAEAGTPYAGATQEELLSGVPDEYTLDGEAIAHLDDVNDLTSTLFMPILGTAVLAGFCLMATYRMFGSAPVGRALAISGGAVLAIIAVLALWGLFGFSGLFAGLHELFFEDGTWLFPADSLLITMYPQEFWMGMGAVWAVTSALLGAISLAAGIIFGRRQKRKGAEDAATQAEPAAPALPADKA